jgi:hypothetical protein
MATPQLSCGSTSLPHTPPKHEALSVKVYSVDDDLDDLEIDIGVKPMLRLYDNPAVADEVTIMFSNFCRKRLKGTHSLLPFFATMSIHLD